MTNVKSVSRALHDLKRAHERALNFFLVMVNGCCSYVQKKVKAGVVLLLLLFHGEIITVVLVVKY